MYGSCCDLRSAGVNLGFHRKRIENFGSFDTVISIQTAIYRVVFLQALARHSTTKREKDQRKQRRLQREDEAKDDQDDAASVTSTIQSTEASSVANDPTVLDEK